MNRRDFLKTAGMGSAMIFLPRLASARLPEESAEQFNARMKWWREARFGMFIHWGVYSVPAGIWKGRKVPLPGEWIMHNAQIPKKEYQKLAPQFNPVKFNAGQWVEIAKSAGMKYMVITSKHHDGFCMFDSQLTDWDIMDATPFKRDVIKELAQACPQQGIRFGIYYSILDWWWAGRALPITIMPRFSQYLEYMKGQIKELLTRYGKISVLFFDGDWIPQWNNKLGAELERYCRSFQPQIIINDRIGKRPQLPQILHKYTKQYLKNHLGDYITPEQFIPPKDIEVDWETCMTMNRSWGYVSWDEKWKSTRELIQKLVDITSKGGNFLLNVGPTSEGLIPEPSVVRLKEIGEWLKINGEAIYGTSPGPVQNLSIRSTWKDNKIYLHIFDWKEEILIPGWEKKIQKARLLTQKGKINLSFQLKNNSLLLHLPPNPPFSSVSVIVME